MFHTLQGTLQGFTHDKKIKKSNKTAKQIFLKMPRSKDITIQSFEFLRTTVLAFSLSNITQGA